MMWKALSAIGFLLLGMDFIEKSLERILGSKVKEVFIELTKNPFGAIFSGTLVTAILQSSSLVSLLLLAFVGGNILPLSNALGVILGANLGTTFTGWIVAFFGLKVNILSVGIPFLGIGLLGLFLFNKSSRFISWFKLLAGLGFLFFALSTLKAEMSIYQSQFDIEKLADLSIFYYFIFGFIATAVIQSSSAMMILVLLSLDQGIFNMYGAAAIVVGADLGTTTTTLLGAIGGSVSKKRLALGQFLFNLIVAVVCLLFIYPYIDFILNVLKLESPLYSLVFFHSTFNFLGIIAFVPFLKKFSKFLTNFITEDLQNKSLDLSEWQVPELHLNKVKELLELHLKEVSSQVLKYYSRDFIKHYISIKNNEDYIIKLLDTLTREFKGPTNYSNAYSFIENLSLSLKSLKDVHHNLEDLKSGDTELYDFVISNMNLHKFVNEANDIYLLNDSEQREVMMKDILIANEKIYLQTYERVKRNDLKSPMTLLHILAEINTFKKSYSLALLQFAKFQ